LLRNPADGMARIWARRQSASKALTLAWLSHGFSRDAQSAGFDCNDGFGGVSDFDVAGVEADFGAAVHASGSRHLVMCHPGFVDDELRRLDCVTERRQKEFEFLMRGGVGVPIWRPDRNDLFEPIIWPTDWTAAP
jgi:chitin disaccharide deacetylase